MAGSALVAEADGYGAPGAHEVAPRRLADEGLDHALVGRLIGRATAPPPSAGFTLPISEPLAYERHGTVSSARPRPPLRHKEVVLLRSGWERHSPHSSDTPGSGILPMARAAVLSRVSP